MAAKHEAELTLKEAEALAPDLVALRRAIHRRPELGFDTQETAALLARSLHDLGIPTKRFLRGGGLVGLIQGAKAGPVVALRAEIDALAIQEENDIAYRSEVQGTMHACGHDAHAACLVGAARLLIARRGCIAGSVKLILQPAEETDQGARALIDEGVLADPPVDVIFGLHNLPGLPTGVIAVRAGPLMASSDSFRILIEGVGGHAAIPDETIDALLAGAVVVQGLQTIVSRTVSPLQPAVVSVGEFRAGGAPNAVASAAELVGITRALDPATRTLLAQRIQVVVQGACDAIGARGTLEFYSPLPVLINDSRATEIVRLVGRSLLGASGVRTAELTMASEDFSLYLERVPGCFFFLGATGDLRSSIGWHHARFDLDETALPIGSAVLAQAAVECMRHWREDA